MEKTARRGFFSIKFSIPIRYPNHPLLGLGAVDLPINVTAAAGDLLIDRILFQAVEHRSGAGGTWHDVPIFISLAETGYYPPPLATVRRIELRDRSTCS